MKHHSASAGVIAATLDGAPLEAAAAYLMARECSALPDLSPITVLLPTLYPAAEFSAALGRAAGRPTVLLPRITTLKAWAERVPIEPRILANSQREALLYQALKTIDWLQGADLWQISAELLTLFDELTTSQIALPPSFDAFLQQLETAYRGSSGAPLHFEATLVHQLWFAMVRGAAAEIDPAAAYLMQLSQLATQVSAPVYAIGLHDLAPAEKAFLTNIAQRQPVIQLHSAGNDPAHELLAAAWANPEHNADLRSRALACRARHLHSPLQGKLTLFAATGLEQEAQAVDVKVRQWLLAGKKCIAVIVQDRLVARRARALLERAQVLVADETGWTFSTIAASTVIHRWLDNLAGHFYHRDLLDLLKSPYLLADWDVARRKHAVYALEQLLRRHQVVSRLDRYLRLARRAAEASEIAALLQRLIDAERRLKRYPQPLAAWLSGLLNSLDTLGVCQGLSQDIAGQQLLELLSRLQRELETDSGRYCFAEWRDWLNRQLEHATFRDTAMTSPVVFTHLANTRLRRFDGVIVSGADAAHLPGAAENSVFFNQGVRAQLGLATQRDKLDGLERDLIALLAGGGASFITWQGRRHAETAPASPYVARLQTFHRLAYHDALQSPVFTDILTHGWAVFPPEKVFSAPRGATPPRPALPAALVPTAVSASGHHSLMACPYQYFARHVLQLNPLDEVREGLEKRDYGDTVHRILQCFHNRYPVISEIARETLAQALATISDDYFAAAIDADYLSHGWALRWKTVIPAYLDWQLAREAAGWRIAGGELVKTREIPLESERTLTIKGRIDRIDIRSDGQLAVLDYKTQRLEQLKKRLDPPGEDVQLPLYAWLVDGPVANASFLSLENNGKRLESAGLEGDLPTLCEATLDRLTVLFNRLYRGAPLPAHGAAESCGYCEMRGLCRKDYWDESSVS